MAKKAAASDRDNRKAKVLGALNKARSMELYAITQYMAQHYILDDLDYGKLAANIKLIAIDEMRHAERFAERIKDLGGEPVTDRDPTATVKRGQGVKEIFPFDSAVEEDTIDVYNQLILICRENGDNISARLLEDIVVEEQAHQTYFDDEAVHIKSLGETYLSQIAGTPATTGPASKGFTNQGTAAG